MAEKDKGLVHRIAVLSDTHGLLRPEVMKILMTCEHILHGGDISSQKVLDALKEVAPVHAVRGNDDKGWAADIPRELSFTLFGLHIYMVHDKKHRRQDLTGTDLFICGHSHKYEEKEMDGVHMLDPGSCGPRRFRLPVTMAILEIAEGTGAWQITRIDLAAESAKGQVPDADAGELKAIVERIEREMRAGRRIDLIARQMGLDSGFVEQVCRICATHPGVDAQGIVDKMEVNALRPRSSKALSAH